MASPPPQLRRALRLPDLLVYGIILVQPTAPMPLFGVLTQQAQGHAVTTVFFAMVAMLFTAISYGRMARAYPSAGSAFTYVGQEIHPTLGFATGWAMILDYVLNPVICTIWCAKAAGNIVPQIPYPAWAIFFALLFTGLNLRGIQASARTNRLLVGAMSIVIVWFFAAAARMLAAMPEVGWLIPIYDPKTFSMANISTGTSLAVLTYIGFDGISTLSEEVENPRRNILLATVFTCVAIGVLSIAQVWAGQLVWPDWATYPDADTAFVHVAGRAGGPWLFQALNATLLVATVGSGMGALGAGARLLYGMGRDGFLPSRFFAHLHPERLIPSRNVMLGGTAALIGAFLLDYQTGAELLNFGAILGFMGVNLSALVRYWWRAPRDGNPRTLTNLLPPLTGFLICLALWVRLRPQALVLGLSWLAIGFIYLKLRPASPASAASSNS